MCSTGPPGAQAAYGVGFSSCRSETFSVSVTLQLSSKPHAVFLLLLAGSVFNFPSSPWCVLHQGMRFLLHRPPPPNPPTSCHPNTTQCIVVLPTFFCLLVSSFISISASFACNGTQERGTKAEASARRVEPPEPPTLSDFSRESLTSAPFFCSTS